MTLHWRLDRATELVEPVRSLRNYPLIQKWHKKAADHPSAAHPRFKHKKGTELMLHAEFILLVLSSWHRENSSFLPSLSNAVSMD